MADLNSIPSPLMLDNIQPEATITPEPKDMTLDQALKVTLPEFKADNKTTFDHEPTFDEIANATAKTFNQFDAPTEYIAGKFKQSNVSRELSQKAIEINKLKREGKDVPEDLQYEYLALKGKRDSITSDMAKATVGGTTELAADTLNVFNDKVMDIYEHPMVVAGATATGATAGGLGLTIPLVGVAGTASGFVAGTMAAGFLSTKDRTMGETLVELNDLTREDGTPYNISENTKDNIATGVGYMVASVDLFADKLLADRVPFIKNMMNPSQIRNMSKTIGGRRFLDALGTFGRNVAESAAVEGSTEGFQELIQVFGEYLGKTWDGSETSFISAISNFNKDAVPEILGGNSVEFWKRPAESALAGAKIGATIAAFGGIIPAGRQATQGTKNSIGVETLSDNQPISKMDDTRPVPYDSQRLAIVDNMVSSSTPQQSLNLGVILQNEANKLNQSLKEASGVEMGELYQKSADGLADTQIWITGDELNKFATTSTKAAYVKNNLSPDQLVKLEQGAPIKVDGKFAMGMIQRDGKAFTMFKPSSTGMTFGEAFTALNESRDNLQKAFKDVGLNEATTQQMAEPSKASKFASQEVDTTNLGPDSTDQDIAGTLKNQREANLYQARIVEEQERLNRDTTPDEVFKGVKLEESTAHSDVLDRIHNPEQLNTLISKAELDVQEAQNDIKGRLNEGKEPTKAQNDKLAKTQGRLDLLNDILVDQKTDQHFANRKANLEEANQHIATLKSQIKEIESRKADAKAAKEFNDDIKKEKEIQRELKSDLKAATDLDKQIKDVEAIVAENQKMKADNPEAWGKRADNVLVKNKEILADLKKERESIGDPAKLIAESEARQAKFEQHIDENQYSKEDAKALSEAKSQLKELEAATDKMTNNRDRIQKLGEVYNRVEAIKQDLPDKSLVMGNQNPLTEQGKVDAALNNYVEELTTTDMIAMGLPKAKAEALQRDSDNVKKQMTEASNEAAQLEMGHTIDQIEALALLQAKQDAIAEASMNPDTQVVEAFLENKANLKVDVETLTDAQKARYANDPVLEERGVFAKNNPPPKKPSKKPAKRNGIHIEEMAQQLGKTAEEVLHILSTAKDKKTIIEEAVNFMEEEMNKKQPIAEVSSAGIINALENKQKMNESFIKELAASSWKKFVKLSETLTISKIKSDEIVHTAERLTKDTKIGELDHKAYAKAANVARNKKIKAINRGDVLEASRQHELEHRNIEMQKQTMIATGKSNKIIRSINQMLSDPRTRETLRKANMLKAFEELSGVINFGVTRADKQALGAYAKLQKKLMDAGLVDITIPEALTQGLDPRGTVKDISLNQLEYIHGHMTNIVSLAKTINTINDKHNAMTFDVIKSHIIEELKKSKYYDENESRVQAENEARGIINALNDKIDLVDTSMTNVQYIISQAFGDDLSAAHQFFTDQLFGVGNYSQSGFGLTAYNKLKGGVNDHIQATLKKYGEERIKSYGYTFVDGSELEGSIGLIDDQGQVRKSHLMGIMALYGSETGRQRLENFGVPVERLKAFAEKHLTHEDMAYINEGIHGAFKSLEGEIVKTFKAMGKEPPEFIKGMAYEFNGKTFEGGYTNIVYRNVGEAAFKVQVEEDAAYTERVVEGKESLSFDTKNADNMTKQGQYEERQRIVNILPSLDLSRNFAVGIENVVTDVTMRVPMFETMKVLNDPEVSKHFKQTIGERKLKVLKHHILSAGKSNALTIEGLFRDVENEWSSVFGGINRNVVSSTLLFLKSSVLSQTASSPFLIDALADTSNVSRAEVSKRHVRNMGTLMLQMFMKVKGDTRFEERVSAAAKIDPSIGHYALNIDDRVMGEFYKGLPKDKSKNKIKRVVSDLTSSINDTYFRVALGTMDTIQKVAAIETAQLHFIEGKVEGYGLDKLTKMTEEEVMKLADSYAFNRVNKTGTSVTILDKAYIQKSDKWMGWNNFFNDQRNQYNYLVYSGARPMKQGVNSAVKLVGEGKYKEASAELAGPGYRLVQLQMLVGTVNFMLAMSRGRDAEGDELPDMFTGKWDAKVWETFLDSYLDPYAIPKTVGSAVPIVGGIIFGVGAMSNTNGKFIPQNQQQFVRGINDIGQAIYAASQLMVNGRLSNKEKKQLIKGMGAITPFIPANAISKQIGKRGTDWGTSISRDPGIIPKAYHWITDYIKNEATPEEAEVLQVIRDEMIDPNRTVQIAQVAQNEVGVLDGFEMNQLLYTTPNKQFEFDDLTWRNIQATHPDLGLTDKNDVEQQMKAQMVVNKDIALTLLRHKVDPTLETVYASQLIGETKVGEIWNKEDSEPFEFEGGKTVGDFKKKVAEGIAKANESLNKAFSE